MATKFSGCFWLVKRINLLNFFLPGDTAVLQLQYSSLSSAVAFLKYFTYLIISNRIVKFNIEIKLNTFSVLLFNLLNIASIIQDFHFSNCDASSINN